ncbi:hypothetical protein BT96DRAFT_920597 [Gymnopus androsaceus JB14]|uniref:Ricin B lectin domain-containing protein n=1 Tax=Gymnopus androsaceus JB14 TaxID=1447944 RepID=A0A6A4HLE3_9AGAR|nr:hypothetical protein BT96DRAFT_920597 [Gymnopus androsaceus JB14]
MFFFNIVYVTVLSLLASTSMVSASPSRTDDFPIPQEVARRLTNAKRLAHGFPLKAPHRRHHGTRTHEHRAVASQSAPRPSFEACIEVRAESDGTTSYGYLNKYLNSDGSVKLDRNLDECLCFIFTEPFLSGRTDSLETCNGPDVKYPFLGSVDHGDGRSHFTSVNNPNLNARLHPDTHIIELNPDASSAMTCVQDNGLFLVDNCENRVNLHAVYN